MSNKLASFSSPVEAPPMRRYGGKIGATSELAVTAIGDTYFVEGSGSVLNLPNWGRGPTVLFHIVNNPTFVHSARLLMPGGQPYTASPGDTIYALPIGDMVWRVVNVCRADGIPYLPASKTLFPAPQGRLTLTPGTAVTQTDVGGAGSVYFTPLDGDLIALFDGKTWTQVEFPETTLSLSGFTANTNCDVWGRISAGVLTMDVTAWSSDTARATAIAQQNGIDVKSGDSTRRLLGTVRTIGTTGQTSDTVAFRYVSNRYNPAPRDMRVLESTSSWSYQSATLRQANGNASNQLDVMCCVPRMVAAEVLGLMSNTTTFGNYQSSIGINSTTVDSSTIHAEAFNVSTTGIYSGRASYAGMVPAGRNKIVWIESVPGANGGTMTQYGNAGGPSWQSGIVGMVMN